MAAPLGLVTARIAPPELVSAALAEAEILLFETESEEENEETGRGEQQQISNRAKRNAERQHRRRAAASLMSEVGWSFTVAQSRGERVLARPLADFPAIGRLLGATMAELKAEGTTEKAGSAESDGVAAFLDEDRLNVIVRRYRTGQGLPPHVDRRENSGTHSRATWFREPVYGAVVRNTSPQSLFFLDSVGGRFDVPEEEGTVFRQCGPSRFDCRHGVDPLESGERISITWRWFTYSAAELAEVVAREEEERNTETASDARSASAGKSSGISAATGSSSNRRAILAMGGAFNPPHTGHVEALRAAKAAAEEQGIEVVAGFLAPATDGYLRRKAGKEFAIPADHRVALCNAACEEHDFLRPISRTYGSANELATHYRRTDREIEVIIVGGGDKLRGRGNQGAQAKKGNKSKPNQFQKMFVSRGAGADRGSASAMLPAPKPGVSSTYVRDRLVHTPGLAGVKLLVEEGVLSPTVAREIEGRIGQLQKDVPRLFGEGKVASTVEDTSTHVTQDDNGSE
jgi:phosphopantetheine adenylyltransferase